jgi:hypothetical protein
MNVRATRSQELEVRSVQSLGPVFQETDINRDARFPKLGRSLARDLGEWIQHGRHYPSEARPKNRIGARRRFSMMTAGLQGHVQRRALGRLSCLGQGVDFRMGQAEAFVPAFSDQGAALHYHGADQRIRFDITATPLGQLERPGHPFLITIAHGSTLQEMETRGTSLGENGKSLNRWGQIRAYTSANFAQEEHENAKKKKLLLRVFSFRVFVFLFFGR